MEKAVSGIRFFPGRNVRVFRCFTVELPDSGAGFLWMPFNRLGASIPEGITAMKRPPDTEERRP